MRLLILLLAALVLLPGLARAHALDPGYLELAPLSDTSWRVTWRAPDVGGKPMPLGVSLPEGCSGAPAAPASFDGRAWVSGWIATCPEGLAGGTIRINGLENTATDTLVRYELAPGQAQMHRLTAGAPAFTVPGEAGMVEIFTSYVSLGFSHILAGVDHLLFVFAMLLLIPTYRRLFWAVTAFTLAHSLTLALAALDVVRVPPAPVEAVIALSIAFLAYELCLPAARRDPLTLKAPWLLSFAFGLIHGLGFAGALREIGLPEADIPLALFAFNVGVELGQLSFIALVLLVGAVLRLILPLLAAQNERFRRSAGYVIGCLSAFWVIDRIAGF